MKLLIVGPSLKMGGIERASSILANAFAVSGNNVSYIAVFPQEHFFELSPNINLIEPSQGHNSNKLHLIRTLFWLRKKTKIISPDNVLVFNYFYGALVCLSLAKSGIPVFVSDRSSPIFKWSPHVNFFNKIIFSILPPTGLVAQTEAAAEKQRNFFKKRVRIKVIPNALREVRLYANTKRQKKVLGVGRLKDPLKGFDRLLQAFAKCRNRDWKLVFAGGDEQEYSIIKQAKDLGVSDRVELLGKVKDIDKVYSEVGLFVIPSRSEGFPNALCEAMAAGLACISFDFIAGPREIITNGHDGLLVEDGNIEALAKAIDYLIENPKERERLGQNALEIRDRLRLDKIGQAYLEFILNNNING